MKKDKFDKEKYFGKVRLPTPPPGHKFQPRKAYTKNKRRPSTRQILEEHADEDVEDICEVEEIDWSEAKRVKFPNLKPTEGLHTVPYITKKMRERYDPTLSKLIETFNEDDWEPGNLNYVISTLLKYCFNARTSYTTGNELMGVLDCVSKEFYRRELAPYEDKKIKENGDLKVLDWPD